MDFETEARAQRDLSVCTFLRRAKSLHDGTIENAYTRSRASAHSFARL